jgi:hypothetical protein
MPRQTKDSSTLLIHHHVAYSPSYILTLPPVYGYARQAAIFKGLQVLIALCPVAQWLIFNLTHTHSGLLNQSVFAVCFAGICIVSHELMKRKRRGSKVEGLGSVESWEFG